MASALRLRAASSRRAIERLTQFVAASFNSARTSEAPFYHLQFDRVFPDDVYAAMLTAMPVASDYRPMSGRAKGNDLADGTHTRVKIDLFPEYIRKLPPEKRAVWDIVGHALCAVPVKEALMRRLAPGLGRMGAVIDAGTENLVRVWDHRQPLDIGPFVVGLGRVGGLAYFGKPAGRERVTQARATETLVQGDHAIVGHHAETRLSIGHIACKLHSQPHVARYCP